VTGFNDKPWETQKKLPLDTPYTTSKTEKTSSTAFAPRCYESHPPYPVTDDLVIYGGSCGWPIVKDADIYGGFDGGMHLQANRMPWHPNKTGPVEFLFKITDMNAPKDPVEFKLMIEWLAEQLQAGKKIHLGCIGGHGRTGTVLAALRKHMAGDEDATEHVRTHYCKKAVESTAQIKFLKDHWEIKEAKPTKNYSYGSAGKSSTSNVLPFGGQKYHDYGKQGLSSKPVSTGQPLLMANSIWGGISS
jgi:hypothetical protein